jgi:hypothetical protein
MAKTATQNSNSGERRDCRNGSVSVADLGTNAVQWGEFWVELTGQRGFTLTTGV